MQPPVEEGRRGTVQSYRVGVPCPRPRDFGEPQLGFEKQDKGRPCAGSKVSWSLEGSGGALLPPRLGLDQKTEPSCRCLCWASWGSGDMDTCVANQPSQQLP